MIQHPSYNELIDAVNSDVPEGEDPIVTSRYSIIHAAAKRARQLVSGEEPLIDTDVKRKPLSVAVDELYTGKVKILRDEPDTETEKYTEEYTEEYADEYDEGYSDEYTDVPEYIDDENDSETGDDEEAYDTDDESEGYYEDSISYDYDESYLSDDEE